MDTFDGKKVKNTMRELFKLFLTVAIITGSNITFVEGGRGICGNGLFTSCERPRWAVSLGTSFPKPNASVIVGHSGPF
jgi:hypothetical protein